MSYIVIDVDGCAILKRAPTLRQASLWADLAASDVRVKVCPPLASSFSGFTEDELVRLAKSVGTNLRAQPYGEMLQALKALARTLEIDETSVEELERANRKEHGKNDTRMERAELPPPPPVIVPHRLTQTKGVLKTSRKDATKKIHKRPAPDTLTGRVWKICDEVDKANPGWTDKKDFRAAVLKRCVKAGLKTTMATTQYSRWVNAQQKR